jgi:hypothetical protein
MGRPKKQIQKSVENNELDSMMGLLENVESGGVKSIGDIHTEIQYDKMMIERKKQKIDGPKEKVVKQKKEGVGEATESKRPINIKVSETSSQSTKKSKEEKDALEQQRHNVRGLYAQFKHLPELKGVSITGLETMSMEQLEQRYKEIRTCAMGYGGGLNMCRNIYGRALDKTEGILMRFDPTMEGMTLEYTSPRDESVKTVDSINRVLDVLDYECFGSMVQTSNPYMRLGILTWDLANITREKHRTHRQKLHILEQENEIILNNQRAMIGETKMSIREKFLQDQLNDVPGKQEDKVKDSYSAFKKSLDEIENDLNC